MNATGTGNAIKVADLDADRQAFRAAAEEWAQVITTWPRRASADPAIEQLHELSRRWAAGQKVRELLTPLLADTEPLAVRVCAATHLYRHGITDVAPVLRELASNTDDVVTTPARAALIIRQRTG